MSLPSPTPAKSGERSATNGFVAEPAAAATGFSFVDHEEAETREAFLGTVSHELKTPITILRLSTQLLMRHLSQDSEPDPARSQVLLKAVDRQSEKLSRLITYLLDVSRTGSGSFPLEVQDTDLVPFVQAIVHEQQSLTDRHPMTLTAPPELSARVDPERMEQVFFNLLDNAVKYSPDGGPIDVELGQPDGSNILISIHDRGVGVAPELREHMFDRFSQAHDPTKPGLGLGLYICRRIVDLHGGELTAEFPQDGGTRMVVSLPGDLAIGRAGAAPKLEDQVPT